MTSTKKLGKGLKMKKIIAGRMYNTDTATCLGVCAHGMPMTFGYYEEGLYQKKSGEYYLVGEGGPMSPYAVRIDANNWSGGSRITPLTEAEARKWAEHNLDADAYIAIYGEPQE